MNDDIQIDTIKLYDVNLEEENPLINESKEPFIIKVLQCFPCINKDKNDD